MVTEAQDRAYNEYAKKQTSAEIAEHYYSVSRSNPPPYITISLHDIEDRYQTPEVQGVSKFADVLDRNPENTEFAKQFSQASIKASKEIRAEYEGLAQTVKSLATGGEGDIAAYSDAADKTEKLRWKFRDALFDLMRDITIADLMIHRYSGEYIPEAKLSYGTSPKRQKHRNYQNALNDNLNLFQDTMSQLLQARIDMLNFIYDVRGIARTAKEMLSAAEERERPKVARQPKPKPEAWLNFLGMP